RAPGESAASVEGPLVDRDCIWRAGSVEAKSCVEDIALAVERNCGIAARFVRATDQVLNARDQCSDLARVGRGRVCGVWVTIAAPTRTAIVGVVCAQVVGAAECAARCRPNHAIPSARDEVARRADDPVRVVWVNCNGRLVLGSRGGVLIYGYGGRYDGRTLGWAGGHVRPRHRRDLAGSERLLG